MHATNGMFGRIPAVGALPGGTSCAPFANASAHKTSTPGAILKAPLTRLLQFFKGPSMLACTRLRVGVLLLGAAGLPAAAWGYRVLRARARARIRARGVPALPDAVRALVFDLDHTLARYNLPQLCSLVHDCAARFLVTERGHDASLLEPYDHAWPALKGLVLDFATGDLLLLDETGAVARARHGARAAGTLDAGAIAARYGAPSCRWRAADALLAGATRGDLCWALTTGYDTGLSQLFARLVDLADARAAADRVPACYDFHEDLYAAVSSAFRQPAFAAGTGGFFSALRANPHAYIQPRPRVAAWLRRLRAQGLRVCIVTNSHADFARFTMRTAFGEGSEAACCDLIVADARKPAFFAGDSPLRAVAWLPAHPDTAIRESAAAEPLGAPPGLPCEHMLAGGSASAVEALFGLRGEAIAFFGDSCFGEVVPARRRGWWTTAVVEEADGGVFVEPLEWGGSFWSAPPPGAEPCPGTSPAARAQSWLGSAFKASAHALIADIDALAR